MESGTDTTLDGLLDRRVTIEQPAKGFRVAIDTVFLAAAVQAEPGERVLEFGCGVGGAMMALAARLPEVSILGIEIQPELAELCQKNIVRNGFGDRLKVECADIRLLEIREKYDHVMMNPPYHHEEAHDVSPDPSKRRANARNKVELEQWIFLAPTKLAAKGTVTIIHRADGEASIVREVERQFGDVRVLHLVPKAFHPPKRVLIQGEKGNQHILCKCSPLVLHEDSGHFTEEAEGILRHANPLILKDIGAGEALA